MAPVTLCVPPPAAAGPGWLPGDGPAAGPGPDGVEEADGPGWLRPGAPSAARAAGAVLQRAGGLAVAGQVSRRRARGGAPDPRRHQHGTGPHLRVTGERPVGSPTMTGVPGRSEASEAEWAPTALTVRRRQGGCGRA